MGSPIRPFVSRTEQDLVELKEHGNYAAIDTFVWLHQFLNKIRSSSGEPLTDDQGRITSHISGLFYRTMNLRGVGINPVFVLEGDAPALKEEEIARRHAERDEAQQAYEAAKEQGNMREVKELEIKRRGVSDEMIDTAIELIDAMGCPYITPPAEAESQCARMCDNGDIDMVISQDYDTLLYGSPNLVQNLDSDSGEYISRDGADFSLEKLIWTGILLGTDYNESAHGVGKKTARKIVNNADSINDVIEAAQEKDESVDGDRWRATNDLFRRPNVDLDVDYGWRGPDRDRILEIMVEKHGFTEKRVGNAVSDATQSSFADF